MESCDILLQIAITETNREDNYFNVMTINQKKSPERMRILEKIEKIYTKEGGTTPVMTREDSFKIVELEADVKDPYKYFTFQPNK